MKYKHLAVTPEQHQRVGDLQHRHRFNSKHQVLDMLLRFYESKWQDDDLLKEIVAEIRGEKDNGDSDSKP